MSSKYQDVIDRIRAKVNNDKNSTSDSVKKESETTSKYQDVIDRIRARARGEADKPTEIHTVPTVEEQLDEKRKQKAEENAPIKLFETKMEVLKHGMPASKAEQFKAWSDQQKSQEIKRGEASPSLFVQTTNALRTPSAKTQAVSDVEVMPGADKSNLSSILANIHNLQNEIKDTENKQKEDYKAANKNIAVLEYDLSILSPSSVTESDFLNAEQKIEDAKKARDATSIEYDNKIADSQDKIASLYGSLLRMNDFRENSKYVSTRQTDENGNPVEPKFNALAGTFATGFDDILYDYINKNEEAVVRQSANNASVPQGGYKDTELQEMTDDEIKIFNYLYATTGKDSAYDFIDYITSDLNARQRQTITKFHEEYAKEHPIISSVYSAISSPTKVLTTVEQTLDYLDDGKIDQNAAYNRYSYVPSAIRETVSEDIEKDLGEFWGPVGSFGYNVGMSMADFVTTTAVSGGNAVVSQIIMGSGAAADTVISAKDRGLNDDQAFALGVVAGLAEAVTEKYSIDALFKTIKAGKGAVVKHILKNMVTEGTEEVASSAINGFADIIVSQDESEWNKAIQNYMSEDGGGYSEDAAFGLALWDQVKSLGLDFIGGAISGAVMGGGSAAIQSAANHSSQSSLERQLNKAIKLEKKQNAALDKLVSADEGNKIGAAAKFVNTVSKTTEKGINSVNASLDFIRNKEKQINNRIKEIDNAGTPSDTDQQEAVQKERAELQKQLDALKATDLMIRENRAEIEDARKRKENAEYVDPGEFDLDADEDVSDTIEDVSDTDESDISTESAQGAETTETGEVDTYSAYAENAVKEAVETAQLNVAKAAKDLLKAYDGDLRAAVDALRICGQSINKGNSRFTRSDANKMYAIDNVLRTSNAQFIGEAANNLRSSLSKYGITNVVVGGKDFVGYGNVGNKANYNRDTGVLTVSPYLDTKEVLAAAVAHELTHHGAKYDLSLVNDAVSLIDSARKSGVISQGDLLYDNYEKAYRNEAASFMRSAKGQSAVKSYVDGGMSAAEAQAQVVKDYINEELAADFLGMLLSQDTDSKAFRTFSGQNRNVIQRILDAITSFIRRLKGEKADADVRQYERAAEMLRDILNSGVNANTAVKDVNADAGKKTDNVVYNSDGEAVASDEGNGSTRWSIDTYQKSGRDTLVRYINSRVDSGALSKTDGDSIVETMDKICKLCEGMTGEYEAFGEWSYASVEVDKDGNPVFSVIKPNGEYIMNLDFSLVCKKRRALDAVLNEMIRRGVISKFDLGQDKIVKINDIIRKNGLEVACSACFVDAKRFRQSKVADDFVKMYNSLVRSMAKGADVAYFNFGGDSSLPDVQNGIDTLSDGDLDMTTINKLVSDGGKSVRHKIAKHLAENPADRKLLSRGDFMSTRGFNLVKKVNPDVLSLYNSKKGSGGPKASFGDVQYLSDIINSGRFNADKAYSVGGVRVQSFSDYVARLVFDYVQMIGDLAAKELPAHAYTKETLFVKQFGLTGMKINMSLMPAVGDGKYAGLNADGSYAWAKESFDYDDAMEIQSDPEYAKNCGTIAVGISDQHIWKLLEDPNIRMVIPYHKSGINPVVAEMNKINRFTNYTNDQNTRYKDGKKLSAEDAKGVPNFNELMHNGVNAIEASRAYVEWCESKGYRPKFDRFVYNSDGTFNENYYKLLEDFTTMVDGVYHPQGAVKAVFPTEGSAFGSMEQLIREGLEQDAVDQFARDEKVGGIVDEVVAMLESGDDVRFSKDVGEAKITASTTDEERTAILETKSIQVPFYDGQADNSISNEKDDLQGGISLVKAALQRIGEEFGVFRNYNIRDIQVKVSFSKRNLKESVSKENDNIQLAKLMPILRDVVENAVGIESHDNRYYYDNMTVSFENLLGAYLDGDYITPVRFGLKHNLSGENILYVIVSQEKIDRKKITAEIVKNPRLQNTADRSSPSTVTYSVSQVVPFVKSKDLLRYLPDSMLDTEQKRIKWEGIAETILRTNEKNDIKYAEFIRSGDLRSAQKMVKAAANANGYTVEAYHGTRGSFNVFSKEHLGSNTHTKTSERWFFASDKETANSYYPYGVMETLYGTEQADKIKNKGNLYHLFLKLDNPLEVDVIDYDYASHRENRDAMMEYSEQADINGNDSIILYNALDNQLKTSARESTVYMFRESSQAKSAETIVYDDDGNIVPISKRFDRSADDIRYAKDVADVRSTEEKLRAENEYLKRQFMSRNGDEWAKAVSPEDVRKISREIAKDLPGVSAGAVEAEFTEVAKVLQRRVTKEYSSAMRYRDAMEAAKNAATKLIMQTDKITVNDEWRDIRDLKKKLRETKLYVSENVASEIPDWQSVRKEISGALSVVTTDRSALPLDSFYSELAEEYPEYFPAEIKIPQQQMERVIKVAKELKGIRQYTHETLWVDAEDTGDTVSAGMANSELVQSFASVMLSKYNESAVETLAAQLKRQDDNRLWNSNSTRNMLAELQRSIPSVSDAEQSGYNRGFFEGRSKANKEEAQKIIDAYVRSARKAADSVLNMYDKNMDKLRGEVENANREAERAKDRLTHYNERTKIAEQRKRYSRNLKTLYNLLTKPTDKRHIPEGLQRAVIDLLSNFSGVKLDNGQTIDLEVLRNLKGRFSMENGSDTVGALDRLVGVVRKNKTSADFSVSDGFIDDMQKTIDFAKEILNEPKTLSKGELQDQIDYYAAYGQNYFAQREFEYLSQVNRVLSMVQKYINDSNKVFFGGKREYAADMADQVATEMRNRPKRSNVPANDLNGADNRPTEFAYDHMQADTFWHMFGDFGDMIMKSYRKAQNYQMEHESEYAEWVKKNIFNVYKNNKGKRYNTHDLGWGGELVTVSADGKNFEITKAQLMSCYVTWNQPEGKIHMTNGGVFFKNKNGEEVDSRHVVFTDKSFAELMKSLSEQDKAICDKVVKFLSERGAVWGNEASMYLYGYKKFTRDYYFPIMAAKSALPVNWEQMTEFSKLESKGMTKARRGDAKNAILIDNFFDVADNHIRNMAAYSAFAPLNNDVRRVFDIGKAQSAVKSVLGDKTTGGKNKKMGGWGYLVDFLQNVDQNKVMAAEQLSSSKTLRILSSMYKRNAVAANLSTAFKQPISYLRAWNVLDEKYLTMAFVDKSFVPFSKEYKRIVEDMTEYSGVAKMKLLGYSDTGSAKSLRAVYDSNYSMLGDEFTNVVARNTLKGYEKISDFFMIAAETADKWTWVRLWKACELEVDAKNKGLSRYARTEAVAELFNQVIGETQVVDTVLDSTPAIRNSDGLTQQMYAFMKEPIKTVNTVFRAWDDVKTGKKSAKKAMTKALVTFAVSNMILEPLISALFGMARDEEDEEGIFWRKLGNMMFGSPMEGEQFSLLDVLTSESVSSIYNTIPVVEEFADVLFSKLQGYDIERMDVSGLAKAIDSVVALWEHDSKKSKTKFNAVSDVVTSFAGLFGMPAYTLKRDVSAAIRLWYQLTDNYKAQWDMNKVFYNLNSGSARSQKNFYDIIAHVIEEGDEDAYQYIREDLSNVFTSDRKGLTANDMLKYMEDRKVEFDYTSRLWNIELQANFDLPQFVPNMQVEPMITAVYRKTNDSSVLPSPPSDNFKVKADAKFSDKLVWNSEKDEKEDSRTVTFKSQADLAEYTEKVGDYAYKTLLCFVNSDVYKHLSDNQKAYAIKQVYKYSQAKYKTELYPDYDPNNDDYAKYIKRNASMSQVANLILKNARKQDK